MRLRTKLVYRAPFIFLIVCISASSIFADVLYVDSQNGNDVNPGAKEKPLRTIGKAAMIVNSRSEAGPTTIKVSPGIYKMFAFFGNFLSL